MAAALAIALSSGYAAASAAHVYKWVDNDGVVHYGDDVPPEYTRKKRQVMDHQGLITNVLPAQKSTEELEAAKKDRERAEKSRRQSRYDKLLLHSWRSVTELEAARDERLRMISSRSRIIRQTISSLEKQLQALKNQADGKHTVPAKMSHRITRAQNRLRQNRQALEATTAKEKAVKQKFHADIVRYKALTTSRTN